MHELGLNAAHLQRNDRRYVLKAPHQMICLMRNMDNGLHGGFASLQISALRIIGM